MARTREPTHEELLRLEKIARKLATRSRWPDSSFTGDVTAACLGKVAPILGKAAPCRGEDIASVLARHFSVCFEEVRTPADIPTLTNKYLRQREIGFGQLPDELSANVDALLFQRCRPRPGQDKFVAVLNLLETKHRAYWNRFHELSHRIAEPAQLTLPLRRHRFEAASPLEQLIDHLAGELAFYRPVFRPLVRAAALSHRLSFGIIEELRMAYAPTASLQSAMNAVVKEWPTPALALTASFRGRKRHPTKDQALRVTPQGRNQAAASLRLWPFPNMRVPETSPLSTAYRTNTSNEGLENLGRWITSSGHALPSQTVYTSAIPLRDTAYAVLSVP